MLATVASACKSSGLGGLGAAGAGSPSRAAAGTGMSRASSFPLASEDPCPLCPCVCGMRLPRGMGGRRPRPQTPREGVREAQREHNKTTGQGELLRKIRRMSNCFSTIKLLKNKKTKKQK